MDQLSTGGTLLNLKFTAERARRREQDLDKLAQLIRTYFRMNGHHVQFNVVDTDTLRRAQRTPTSYRDLIVRVAGYSDYFCDLDRYPRRRSSVGRRRTETDVLGFLCSVLSGP